MSITSYGTPPSADWSDLDALPDAESVHIFPDHRKCPARASARL